MSEIASISDSNHACSNEMYESFLWYLRQHYDRTAGNQLYTTNVTDLFDVYLSHMPEGKVRQHYTCHACKRFINTYGGLVSITDDTQDLVAVMWPNTVPESLCAAVGACRDAVLHAKVTGVFVSQDAVWGQPVTGEWKHMHVSPKPMMCRVSVSKNASQVMAEKKQDFQTLIGGLAEYPLAVAERAVTLLQSEALYRYEKCLGVAEWFKSIHTSVQNVRGARRSRMLWKAVAEAPPGFCHIRSTMIGTLLDDIAHGYAFPVIEKRFASKMNPLQYQRPSAAPSRGNIQQAEKLVQDMGIEASLRRRFARLDDLQTIWLPKPAAPSNTGKDGVFSHIRPKGEVLLPKGVDLPSQSITWAKFRDTVMEHAEHIAYYTPTGRESYCALVTAEDMSAPPIIQWDTLENRNPVSCYVYSNGSYATGWGLSTRSWIEVEGICLQPSMWHNPERYSHKGKSVLFLLKGAYDTATGQGSALFPETLKSELHSIRSTIEAYSHKAQLGGSGDASAACGIRIVKGRPCNHVFRVTAKGMRRSYIIDRWD